MGRRVVSLWRRRVARLSPSSRIAADRIVCLTQAMLLRQLFVHAEFGYLANSREQALAVLAMLAAHSRQNSEPRAAFPAGERALDEGRTE
jgi:hypothetical protein